MVADLSALADDELLVRTRDDPEAFGAFYERHVHAVLGFLGREAGDTQLALDLTAEVFSAVLVASGRFRPDEAPASAWLFGIARNKLLSARRRDAVAFAARRKLGVPLLAFSDEAIERVEETLDAAASGTSTRWPRSPRPSARP